ncbi:MAG: T9SS type A sorting domain-containing protein [Bacteroidota bacterium]
MGRLHYTITLLLCFSITYGQKQTDPIIIANSESEISEQKTTGDLTLQSNKLVEAEIPATIQEIDGDLSIQYSPELASLLDFKYIQKISGDLRIFGNPKLYDLSGLDNLQYIGGDLIIKDNAGLTRLAGLDHVEIGGSIIIEGNPSLESLDYLNIPKEVGGHLRIINNASLNNIQSLASLKAVDGDLLIAHNAQLIDFPGCGVLHTISGDFRIAFNRRLKEIGAMPTLSFIGGSFVLENNKVLIQTGVTPELQSIGGELLFRDLPELTSLGSLEKLERVNGSLRFIRAATLQQAPTFGSSWSVSGDLIFEDNDELVNLYGLTGLQAINGQLIVKENKRLSTLIGLDHIDPTSITSLELAENPALDYCHVEAVCGYLGEEGDKQKIELNNTACSTESTILSFCGSNSSTGESLLTVYPNPVQNALQIDVDEAVHIRIYNSLGQLVLDRENYTGELIDVSLLSSGDFIVEMHNKDSVLNRIQFVKQ